MKAEEIKKKRKEIKDSFHVDEEGLSYSGFLAMRALHQKTDLTLDILQERKADFWNKPRKGKRPGHYPGTAVVEHETCQECHGKGYVRVKYGPEKVTCPGCKKEFLAHVIEEGSRDHVTSWVATRDGVKTPCSTEGCIQNHDCPKLKKKVGEPTLDWMKEDEARSNSWKSEDSESIGKKVMDKLKKEKKARGRGPR